MLKKFRMSSRFKPRGDQPKAIRELVEGIRRGDKGQTLYGVTGSGKTFTMASVIEQVQRPTIVIAHNKTLATQLYGEFKEFFPENAVGYFISYYDYYRPEAYLPSQDVYIEKETKVNEEIDRMRHFATNALIERRDVLIVASVSCIYGIGSAEMYKKLMLRLEVGQEIPRKKLLLKLVNLQYSRNDIDFYQGTFRVRGDTIDIFPSHMEDRAIRIEFWDDEIEKISWFDPFRSRTLEDIDAIGLYPNTHFATTQETIKKAIVKIQDELRERIQYFKKEGKFIEAQRIEQRTLLDIEELESQGYCAGIENYSRHLSGREEGETPPCLLNYFPEDYLIFIDESHVTLPQIRGMYRGDRARKQNLVDFGFRLPSALDNRPLRFDEFEKLINQIIYVSATPGDYELEHSTQIVEQIVRPTGLLDPEIEIRPVENQVDDLLEEIRQRIQRKERILITTLTKKMAENLADYYHNLGINITYLHSSIPTIERAEILRDLRRGLIDVIVGINLLREGLDLPEVSLVAIFDADQQGFLRSTRSLLQTVGRAARHVNGKVILYADQVTEAMQTCLDVTRRQRKLQMEFNQKYGITPKSVIRKIQTWQNSEKNEERKSLMAADSEEIFITQGSLQEEIQRVEEEMLVAAEKLYFERAAKLRDRLKELKNTEKFLFSEKL